MLEEIKLELTTASDEVLDDLPDDGLQLLMVACSEAGLRQSSK